MASWVLAHPPWQTLARVRLRWDVLLRSGTWTSRHFLNTPPLATETPAMQQIKAYPYPATAPDASLFEDTTNEYHEAAEETEEHARQYPLHVEVDHPSSLLKNLVREGKYQDATRVYTELLDMGAEIPLHPMYHFAARHVLNDTTLPPEERLNAFAGWWSLFPPTTQVEGNRAVKSILAHLLRGDPTPDIPLIIQFALIAASKGYVHQVARELVPVVARYATTQVTLCFLEELSSASWTFDSSQTAIDRGLPDAHAGRHLPASISKWYCSAIQELVLVDRTGAALEVLQLARSRDINVSRYTYNVLLSKLSSESNHDGITTVISLRKIQAGHPAWLEIPDEDMKQLGPTATTVQRSDRLHSSVPAASREKVALPELSSDAHALLTTARLLKQSLHAGELPISPATLAEVISVFLKSNRGSLLRRLRARVYQHEHLIPHWALAELIYQHSRRHSLHSIMKVFESHFHVVAVPGGITDNLWEERVAGRSTGVSKFRPPLHRKFPPDARHTYFMWDIILRRARTRSQVRRLYRQFLEDVAAARDVYPSDVPYLASLPDQESTTEQPEYVRVIPPPSLFHPGHFALFIKAFTRADLPLVAARIVVDMYALRVKPDARAFSRFVASLRYMAPEYAPAPVLGFFEKAIKHVDDGDPSASEPYPQTDPLPRSGERTRTVSLKTETLAFVYAGVIKRLLLDRRAHDAVKVAKRFVDLVSYRPGSSVVADKVLQTPVIASALHS
ncbi:hypothetical protein BC628DRAFT_628913 [Trametes gibbosa]|nr:hypothetical protein BC628DRAFT_628913 [Trametes gibbosa]